jgi:hypothetical protein
MMICPKLKTWILTVERDGKLVRVPIEAPTRKLAILNYRCGVSLRDEILTVSLKKNDC